MINYFEFYDLPVRFQGDTDLVKKKYFERSRKYHPDFFINESPEKQQEVLELSTLNTRAFETLSDFDRRMKYILELKDMIHEGERFGLPPEFLMEMMEVNEALMEMREEGDKGKVAEFKALVNGLLSDLYGDSEHAINSYDDSPASQPALQQVKEYYYKKKYLLRLMESLDTFGASP